MKKMSLTNCQITCFFQKSKFVGCVTFEVLSYLFTGGKATRVGGNSIDSVYRPRSFDRQLRHRKLGRPKHKRLTTK